MFGSRVRAAAGRWGVVAFLLVSLTAWTTWTLTKEPCHPYADISCGTFTDHFSHMNTARLFTTVGIDIWRKPLGEHARPLTAAERERLPRDLQGLGPELRAVEGWPSDKPFVSSWSHRPRLHPPGSMVLAAPIAAAYHFTSLSFSDANRLLIVLFLLYAHVSLYVFMRRRDPAEAQPAGIITWLIVYALVILFTLEGFYEAAIVGPLVACAWFIRQGRDLHAIAAFSLALFLHFRALFFLPWVLFAAYRLIKSRAWRTWELKDGALAATAALLGIVSVGVFVLLLPALGSIDINNPLRDGAVGSGTRALELIAFGAVVVAALSYARAWLDVAIALWVFFMVVMLREVNPWNLVTLVTWLGAPLAGVAGGRTMVKGARLLALGFLATRVFDLKEFVDPWLTRTF